MLVMRLPIRLAWNWSMKKRVPESMPTSEALTQACLEHMEENAPGGARLLRFKTRPCGLGKTTPENV